MYHSDINVSLANEEDIRYKIRRRKPLTFQYQKHIFKVHHDGDIENVSCAIQCKNKKYVCVYDSQSINMLFSDQ